MRFAIFTHVSHGIKDNSFYAYSPYVKEMNIWSKYVDDLIILAPINNFDPSNIDISYNHKNINFIKIKSFDFTSFKSICKAFFAVPVNCFVIFQTFRKSDHLHLRCPGNIGLLACVVQIFFPKKIKTAKYAGNWDPKSKQPISYKLQKWILSNTFLTKNMQVLVYGEWENQPKNIKPFFTASYKEIEKKQVEIKNLKNQLKFVFVGTLANGKNPLYAIQIIELLFKKNYNVILDIYGEGTQRLLLENYIKTNKLTEIVVLKGNQNQEIIKNAYIESHFMILPSNSEGWPKAVAEAMFWRCLPISTNISCVSNMLDNGNRGVLIDLNLENDLIKIINILNNEVVYQEKVINAMNWSRKYTLDYFEQEIKLLLQV